MNLNIKWKIFRKPRIKKTIPNCLPRKKKKTGVGIRFALDLTIRESGAKFQILREIDFGPKISSQPH